MDEAEALAMAQSDDGRDQIRAVRALVDFDDDRGLSALCRLLVSPGGNTTPVSSGAQAIAERGNAPQIRTLLRAYAIAELHCGNHLGGPLNTLNYWRRVNLEQIAREEDWLFVVAGLDEFRDWDAAGSGTAVSSPSVEIWAPVHFSTLHPPPAGETWTVVHFSTLHPPPTRDTRTLVHFSRGG